MFSVFEYLSRIERAHLDILEDQDPINKVITLWWGLDGLRVNEDGTTKWVSRRKREPSKTVFYQPCQSIRTWTDQTQSTRAQIEALMVQRAAAETQCLMDTRSVQMENMIQQCCVQTPLYYPPYYYGGCGGSYIG